MNKTVLVLFSAIFIAIFTSCGEVSNNGSSGNESGNGGDPNITGNCGSAVLDDAIQFCGRDNRIHDLCSGKKYDTEIEFCFGSGIESKCFGKEYNLGEEFCSKEKKEPLLKCEGKDYNYDNEFCYREKLYPRCGDMAEYDPLTTTCCGGKKITFANEFCCFGKSYPVNGDNFCYEDELYPKCRVQKEIYNPRDSGCFENDLYPKCINENVVNTGITGKCVHNNGLLRCKQLGNGSSYVIDPLPGMTCNPTGAITGEITDLRTAEKYKVAQIGKQIWLAEDLKYIPTMLDGTNDSTTTGITTIKGECYNVDTKNCTIYGRMYDWATAMRLSPKCNGTNQNCPSNRQGDLWQGLCPPSFGFPKTADWNTLITYAGGDAIAGGRLKSTSSWSYSGNGTDDYGFNALPGGYYTDIIEPTGFKELGARAMWWVDDQKTSEAYYITIISSDTDVRTNFQQKGFYKAYVRCVHYY